MVDIGSTVRLNGAYKSIPSTPGNGQIGTPANNVAFFGTNITNYFLSSNTTPTVSSAGQSRKLNSLVNLPAPATTHYYLAANLTAGNAREYWSDITPSLVNAPSGAGAYDSSSLTVLGTFQVNGSVPIPTVTSTYPTIGNAAAQFYVSIDGSNFLEGATVTFNDIAATEVTVISSKIIYCLAPIISTYGTIDVVVTNTNTKNSGATGDNIFTCPVDPIVISITPSSGVAGTSITDLQGTGFITGATVSFDGTSATNVVVVSPTQITCTTPSITSGASDVLVTNTTGQTSGTSGNGIFTAQFSPAILNLTSWLSGDYSGSLPWTGSASAGVSGSYNEVTIGGVAPTSGTLLNGHSAATYNSTTSRSQHGTTIDDFITNTSYTFSALVYFTSTPTFAPTTPYIHTQILCSDARWGISFSSGGITVLHYNGSFNQFTVACTASAWHLIDVRYDGVNVSIRIDAGSWSSQAMPNQQTGLQAMTARNSYTAVNGGGMHLMERITSKLQLSDSELNNYRDYINTRYGTSF